MVFCLMLYCVLSHRTSKGYEPLGLRTCWVGVKFVKVVEQPVNAAQASKSGNIFFIISVAGLHKAVAVVKAFENLGAFSEGSQNSGGSHKNFDFGALWSIIGTRFCLNKETSDGGMQGITAFLALATSVP